MPTGNEGWCDNDNKRAGDRKVWLEEKGNLADGQP